MSSRSYSIVLASASPYRAALLERLRLPFEIRSPDVDETPRAHESPTVYVDRLAQAKAKAAAAGVNGALVIGSDQIATLDNQMLGKPKTPQRAVEQLLAASGRRLSFVTGLAVFDTGANRCRSTVVRYDVHFRRLERRTVERYVQTERPLDCAGSFKAEGLGIALCRRMEGDDPTALIGLPLIALVDYLHRFGVSVP